MVTTCKYLLDTDICIEFLRSNKVVWDKVRAVGANNCYISEITLAELYYGVEKGGGDERQKNDINVITRMFDIQGIFQSLRTFAKNKTFLESQGRRIEDFDLLIGSIAVDNGFVMVTKNVRHYERIPNIVIENWVSKKN